MEISREDNGVRSLHIAIETSMYRREVQKQDTKNDIQFN